MRWLWHVASLTGCLCLQSEKNGNGKHAPPVVGFCFSFAVEQAALNSGKLLVWTKGFNVEGVIGRDVVQLLSGGHTTALTLPPRLCAAGVCLPQHQPADGKQSR